MRSKLRPARITRASLCSGRDGLAHAETRTPSIELQAPRSIGDVTVELVGGRSHELIDQRLACRCPQVLDLRARAAQLAGNLIIEVELSYEQHRVPAAAWAIQ